MALPSLHHLEWTTLDLRLSVSAEALADSWTNGNRAQVFEDLVTICEHRPALGALLSVLVHNALGSHYRGPFLAYLRTRGE